MEVTEEDIRKVFEKTIVSDTIYIYSSKMEEDFKMFTEGFKSCLKFIEGEIS